MQKGVYDSDPMVAEFRAFFISEFGVHLYGYICDKTEDSSGLNRLRYFVDADSRNVFKKPQVVFDSVQTLNDKFEGNLINYYR